KIGLGTLPKLQVSIFHNLLRAATPPLRCSQALPWPNQVQRHYRLFASEWLSPAAPERALLGKSALDTGFSGPVPSPTALGDADLAGKGLQSLATALGDAKGTGDRFGDSDVLGASGNASGASPPSLLPLGCRASVRRAMAVRGGPCSLEQAAFRLKRL